MDSDRIKEIQETTAYPQSVSVHQALLQVWNECEQDKSTHITHIRNILIAFNKQMSDQHSWFLPAEDYMVDEFLKDNI